MTAVYGLVFLISFGACAVAQARGRLHGAMKRGFQAEFEEMRILKGGSPQADPDIRAGRILRDRFGRLRQEIRTQGKSGKTVIATSIIDPVASEVLFLIGEPPALVKRLPLRPGEWPASFWGPSITMTPGAPGGLDEDAAVENLGTRVIEGLRCHGRRVRAHGQTSETWFSDLLPDQPIRISTVTEAEEYTFELRRIVYQDPDPKLFRTPY